MTSDVVVDVPTSKDMSGWLICNSVLGCGTRILQGWSEGIGISQNVDFEAKFARLLLWSDYAAKKDITQVKGYWNLQLLSGIMEAPIGLSRTKLQLLKPKQTYTISSLVPWIERFEAFVKKHDLGDFSKSHVWLNHNYKGAPNITALWTWNGNCPSADSLGLKDWQNNPEKLTNANSSKAAA
jgi:hypothetical protein